MHHHHEAEETVFFPSIEQVSNSPGLMERNVEQHQAFTPGFDAFQEHALTCPAKDYDGQKIRTLIEDFAEPLTRHLHDEIDTLRALDKYDSERIRQAYKHFEKRMMATDNVRCPFTYSHFNIVLTPSQYRIAPLVFGTADRSFEGGMHNFPAVPFFVPFIIHYVFGRRYRCAWRFNPCTAWRDRRELAFKSASATP